MHYTGYCDLYVGCTGDMWTVANSMRDLVAFIGASIGAMGDDVTLALTVLASVWCSITYMWDVEASLWAVQSLRRRTKRGN